MNTKTSQIPYIKTPLQLGLKTDVSGIYINTTSPRIDAMKSTGYLEFGIGDAPDATIAERQISLSSSKNPAWQQFLLDTIPEPGYRDHSLHKLVREDFAVQLVNPDSGKRTEVFKVKVSQDLIDKFVVSTDFEEIRSWLNQKIRNCAAKLDPNHKKRQVNLRNIQKLVKNKIIRKLKKRGLDTNFVCELAARIGKTILFLDLAKALHDRLGHQSMFVMAYGVGLSVKTSYENELESYSNFSDMVFLDASDAGCEGAYAKAIQAGSMPVVFVSLNPEVEEKYEWIHRLDHTIIALLEETDFGTHTDSQVSKVEYIIANKTVTRINASGTNIGRIAKAFGRNSIDEIVSVPYALVEQDPSIPNVVCRKFYNMLFNNSLNKMLTQFDSDLLPNMTKILSQPLSQKMFLTALFQDLFGYQPIYGFNISNHAQEDILHSMLFVNTTKNSMDQLAEIIESACAEHKVLVLNGEYTDNKEAEGLTKETLVQLRNNHYPGRNKLLVITNMMGTRSYSVPEIQACLFMMEGGDVYPYMQKYSRCLTPGFDKKHGHIFDFSFDQSKTRNTEMSIAVEGMLIAREHGVSFPDAVRVVLNSVNIKDMLLGKWLSDTDIIKKFEDNNKLLEVANANTFIQIEDLTQEEIEAFAEIASNYAGSKKERSDIEKTVKTGATFGSTGQTGSKSKKNSLKAIVDKAIRSINGSATTIVDMTNYKEETFLDCLKAVASDKSLQQEFKIIYGMPVETILRLYNHLQVATLDTIVYNSKHNHVNKHIENSSLAILKDNPDMWREIHNHLNFKNFISSTDCKNMLCMAAGHGTEIDVLVEIHGPSIIDKIIYNDKYTFFCNQIRRRYPGIRVIQADFYDMDLSTMKLKPDVVIGNPPYQDKKGNEKSTNSADLYTRFVNKAFELTDHYVAMVIPSAWSGPKRSQLKRLLFEQHQPEVFNTHGKKWFNVEMNTCYFVTRKERKGTTEVSDAKGNSLTLALDRNTAIPVDLTTFVLRQKLEAFSSKSNMEQRWLRGKLHLNKVKSLKQGREFVCAVGKLNDPLTTQIIDPTAENTGHGINKLVIPNMGGSDCIGNIKFATPDQVGGHSVVFITADSAAELVNIKSYLESKIIRFLISSVKISTPNSKQLFARIPELDFNRFWGDAELYRHFGLTKTEIECVENDFT